MQVPQRKGFTAPRKVTQTTPQVQSQDGPSQPAATQQPKTAAEPAADVPERQVLQPVQAYKAPVARAARAKVAARPVIQPAQTKPVPQHQDVEHKSVLYIKKETFLKKKVSKMYMDGLLVLAADGSSTLHSLDTGKVVTTGRAHRATAKDLQPPGGGGGGGWGKKKSKKQEEEEDEEEDDDVVRYLLGTFVVEVQGDVSAESFRSGACFSKSTSAQYGATMATNSVSTTSGMKRSFKPVTKGAACSGGAEGAVKTKTVLRGLYDPETPCAVVLNREEWQSGMLGGSAPAVAPVVVDPYLARHLRPHQCEGVQFMWDCVMGKRAPGYSGCILADEMGLGKTLQVLALVWTLLRQGPTGKPVAGKVLVVTPASLCGNWEKEVKQWLGSERLQVFMLGQQQDAAERVQQFKHGAVVRLCITSYETLRKHSAALAGCIDLLVCDEGHRLKAVGGSKTTEALQQLGCPRHVLLTGTPIQNNLEEFYALVSFVAPGLLGAPSAFRRVYAEPISRATERDASTEIKELGASRATELGRKSELVMLRRTQAILTRHLPPLVNYCLFCKPSDKQLSVYQHIIKKALAGLSQEGSDATLAAITALSKVCNHPGLLPSPDDFEDDPEATAPVNTKKRGQTPPTTRDTGSSWVPALLSLEPDNPRVSGKMVVLQALMERVIANGERMVVVSTSTAALDAVQRLVVAPLGLQAVRIDGGTSVEERQSIVDAFNQRGVGQVFLLSTRAGGAGLNLIGASHLVLYSSDWNPAADLQAMARIWRDGQKRPCHVWRLLTTGTIEEKIYQRQIMKGNLAIATLGNSDAGSAKSGRQFTREELRSLFVLNNSSACETMDLLLASGTAAGRHVRWLTATPQASQCGPLPPVTCAALLELMSSGSLSAASVALKSEELVSDDNGGAGASGGAVMQLTAGASVPDALVLEDTETDGRAGQCQAGPCRKRCKLIPSDSDEEVQLMD